MFMTEKPSKWTVVRSIFSLANKYNMSIWKVNQTFVKSKLCSMKISLGYISGKTVKIYFGWSQVECSSFVVKQTLNRTNEEVPLQTALRNERSFSIQNIVLPQERYEQQYLEPTIDID